MLFYQRINLFFPKKKAILIIAFFIFSRRLHLIYIVLADAFIFASAKLQAYTSRFATLRAFASMNSLRGSTWSPISVVNN